MFWLQENQSNQKATIFNKTEPKQHFLNRYTNLTYLKNEQDCVYFFTLKSVINLLIEAASSLDRWELHKNLIIFDNFF